MGKNANSSQPQSQHQPLVLQVKQVAKLLNLSERTIWRLASTGEIPRPIGFGRSRRWSHKSLEQFVAQKEMENAA
ncbi:MAG: helix-turn-helix domain-containing protein [Phycisphaerales bacterium]|nr:helix-turn-helix domain-containing protein [Phycisphaerales bacterium]